MRIDSPLMTNAIVTGSFSGSFTGAFDGDITADSVAYANITGKPTLLSGSAQIASDISGSFTSVSSSLAADIATNTAAIASLDGSYATDAELNASSSALITAYENADTTLSASLATDIATNTAKVGYTDTLVKAKLNTETVVSGSATDVRSFLNVEDGADVTDSTNVQAAGALMDSEVTNLADVKAFDSSDYATAAQGALADSAQQPPSEGAFANGDKTKLDGIEASADVTDTDNVTAAGALMDTEVSSLSGIKTLTVPDSTTISSFGASLVDDANATAARTTLGVDASGTDNSTDVTLVTDSHDYLSISGQAITLGTVDISDDTNLAVSDTTGQTGINLTLSGDTISGVVSGLDTSDNVQFNDLTVAGNLTVTGTTTSINSTDLNVTDKLISINRGGADAASANGGGLFISGANESLTWDNGNSRFSFSDDLHAAGNITLTGNVDGRDVAADGTKLDGIEASADVTDSTNVQAAGALMDSEVTNLAEVKAFDSSDYATAAQGTTADNALPKAGGQMTGNITFSGAQTVDGRDLSADGTKLDGIETGATADQTQGDINGLLITEVGTITTGTWNGTAIADAYLSTNTAHLSGTQTFSGAKTFSAAVSVTNSTASTSKTTGALKVTGGLGVQGDVFAGGDVVAYASSDERLKDNVAEISNALDRVEKLRGVSFDWNDKQSVYSGHDIGVIAQDVEEVLPELVENRDNGYKAVKYDKLTAVLIQAVKELSARVKELENK